MEDVIARMQDEKNGIPIRTVKSFLSKIPSVFSGKFHFHHVAIATMSINYGLVGTSIQNPQKPLIANISVSSQRSQRTVLGHILILYIWSLWHLIFSFNTCSL